MHILSLPRKLSRVRLKRNTERWDLPQPSDASTPLRGSRLNKLRKLKISVELLDPNGRRGFRRLLAEI